MFSLLAALQEKELGPIRGIGPLGLEDITLGDVCKPATLFEKTLSTIVGVMTVSAIIWFVFQFLVGAIGWISAGGDSKAIEAARKRLTNAVIGLVIILTAMILISVIGALLGIDILNIARLIMRLTPGNQPCG